MHDADVVVRLRPVHALRLSQPSDPSSSATQPSRVSAGFLRPYLLLVHAAYVNRAPPSALHTRHWCRPAILSVLLC